MILEHAGERPRIDPSAYVAPTAVVCGDVEIGPETVVLFGAVVTAESGPVTIGAHCIVMENAVLRGVARHPLSIGDSVLIGPHAHVTGAIIDHNVFVATGATVFNGAHIAARCEVRVNAVVHTASTLPADTTVPIGWIAVGDPSQMYPPERHDDIWAVQQQLDFPRRIFGTERAATGETQMPEIARRYTKALARYRDATLADA